MLLRSTKNPRRPRPHLILDAYAAQRHYLAKINAKNQEDQHRMWIEHMTLGSAIPRSYH